MAEKIKYIDFQMKFDRILTIFIHFEYLTIII